MICTLFLLPVYRLSFLLFSERFAERKSSLTCHSFLLTVTPALGKIRMYCSPEGMHSQSLWMRMINLIQWWCPSSTSPSIKWWVFSCPDRVCGQLNMWHCHSLTEWLSHFLILEDKLMFTQCIRWTARSMERSIFLNGSILLYLLCLVLTGIANIG